MSNNKMSAIIEGLNISRFNESAKTANPIDKYDKDISFDGKKFYFKGSNINTPELAEEALHYFSFKGIHFKREALISKDDIDKFFKQIWKSLPARYHITIFGERGVVRYAIKNGNKIDVVNYKGEIDTFDGAWFMKNAVSKGDSVIFSKEHAPMKIKYTDISNDFGKTHSFQTSTSDIKGGKKLNYEDDVVTVYDKNLKIIYNGIEDYEPMKEEDWKWDSSKKYYMYKDYIKVVG